MLLQFSIALSHYDYKVGLQINHYRPEKERLHEPVMHIATEEFSVQACPLCFDVRDNEVAGRVIASIPLGQFRKQMWLVNNAGLCQAHRL